MKTLVINSGSSSIKYCLFDVNSQAEIISGIIDKIGNTDSSHKFTINEKFYTAHKINTPSALLHIPGHKEGLAIIFSCLVSSKVITDSNELFCIGHRVVHGGEKFRHPVIINQQVIKEIRNLEPLAPLHNPANLLGIEESIKTFGAIPQVAVFDTAYHQTIPEHAYRYALPQSWYEKDSVRRYGFHGTSHNYVARQAADYLKKPLQQLNLITLHLGNGASMTAIKDGVSIDTSMGMTPLEGLMMGTRCGDIDPAIPFYAGKTNKLNNSEIEITLNKKSGLQGICGESDMRAVHKLADQGDLNAQLALNMYVYRIKKYLGAYYAILGHVDAIIFTGGVDENDSWIREQCCENLDSLGIGVNKEKNHSVNSKIYDISTDSQSVSTLVIKTNEELEIALQSVNLIKKVNI